MCNKSFTKTKDNNACDGIVSCIVFTCETMPSNIYERLRAFNGHWQSIAFMCARVSVSEVHSCMRQCTHFIGTLERLGLSAPTTSVPKFLELSFSACCWPTNHVNFGRLRVPFAKKSDTWRHSCPSLVRVVWYMCLQSGPNLYFSIFPKHCHTSTHGAHTFCLDQIHTSRHTFITYIYCVCISCVWHCTWYLHSYHLFIYSIYLFSFYLFFAFVLLSKICILIYLCVCFGSCATHKLKKKTRKRT